MMSLPHTTTHRLSCHTYFSLACVTQSYAEPLPASPLLRERPRWNSSPALRLAWAFVPGVTCYGRDVPGCRAPALADARRTRGHLVNVHLTPVRILTAVRSSNTARFQYISPTKPYDGYGSLLTRVSLPLL